ncbi:MAG: tRNA (5-methylaminomethyl-2-thiouridylate)-methyltransferase [Pseudomonadota bacterium]|jgi:tRNA-specific 2-thiouridylase
MVIMGVVMKGKVLVAASGGVDSSMSAKKLKDSGYKVTAIYAKMHGHEEKHESNIANIKKVADFLKIDFIILNLQERFEQEVIKPFTDSYLHGQTPNPCVLCNRTIKFGELIDFALKNGFDYLATGHYAKTDGKFMYEAKDKKKDQSYFLYGIKPENLPRLLFPLQDIIKEELKAEAATIPEFANLSTQKESSEICFVENNYIEVLDFYGAEVENPGDVLDANGNVIGKHKGYLQYTIGQRKGFDAPRLQTPHYVVDVNPQTNQIVVAEREHLGSMEFTLASENWFEKPKNATVKIRYQSAKIECEIDGNLVKLKEPAFAITSGQSAVFYDGEKVLGGGVIA